MRLRTTEFCEFQGRLFAKFGKLTMISTFQQNRNFQKKVDKFYGYQAAKRFYPANGDFKVAG